MIFFSFTAPTLLEPDADTDAVLAASDVCYNASRESMERLAKIKKFVVWLKAEMEKAGLPVENGLVLDGESGGWFFDVASKEGSVMCIVSNLDGDGTRISLNVTEMRDAAEGVDRAVEALLSRSSEIVGLEVDAP
jgi:hypothetical protein